MLVIVVILSSCGLSMVNVVRLCCVWCVCCFGMC